MLNSFSSTFLQLLWWQTFRSVCLVVLLGGRLEAWWSRFCRSTWMDRASSSRLLRSSASGFCFSGSAGWRCALLSSWRHRLASCLATVSMVGVHLAYQMCSCLLRPARIGARGGLVVLLGLCLPVEVRSALFGAHDRHALCMVLIFYGHF